MTRLIPLLAVALFTAVPFKVDAASDSETIRWQDWSAAVFERAREEGKLVLLDLEAGWCHWCHVMDQTTYRDPEVIDLIRERYIPVRADQDAHPDLSNRYEDYGWPATVIFDGTGTEILKKRGYIRPQWMLWTLQAVAENPSPDAHDNKQSVPEQASRDRLSDEQRQVLNERYEYDPAAQRLFAAAIRYPLAYKRVEWWDRREGELPNPDVIYPQLPTAAAFACANQACSLPVFEPEQIVPAVDRLQSQ